MPYNLAGNMVDIVEHITMLIKRNGLNTFGKTSKTKQERYVPW